MTFGSSTYRTGGDVPGRELVQIVEIRQPICANTYGTAPCTATGGVDVKCYNCRAGCQDTENYRHTPDDHLSADLLKSDGDTVTSGEITRTADLFAAFDVTFDGTPEGTIWEQGGTTQGAYLGITGSNLVFRAGDGSVSDGVNVAKITYPVTSLVGLGGTLYVEIDVSTDTVTLWWWDVDRRELTELGSDTATSGLPASWADATDGGVGIDNTVPTGEDGGAWNGGLSQARFYDSASAPDMTADFVLPLYFGRKQVSKPPGLAYVMPFLESVSTTPTRLNVVGSNRNASPLGLRSVCRVTMSDHPGTDRIVDPYRSGRTFDPSTRGSWWTKWLVRNKFGKLGATMIVYEGYKGQTLSQMTARRYEIENIDGPNEAGTVTIRARDILARLDDRKAQAPVASPGALYADITDIQTTIEVAGATEDDYDASGTLRINNEVMTYSSVTTNVDNRLEFTISGRGTDGTTADAHSTDDTVQLCLRYTEQRADAIIEDLQTNYAGVPYSLLDRAAWKSEFDSFLPAYNLTALITSPEPVNKLLAEICEQATLLLWWDEREQKVKLKGVRALDAVPDTLTQEEHILEGSVSLKELPTERVSRVLIRYNQTDPTKNLDDPTNRASSYLAADFDLETPEKYGVASTRVIYARWLPTFALVLTTASKIQLRYSDVPQEITFSLDAKDASYWVGDTVILTHYLLIEQYGQQSMRQWLILSADEVEPGHVVRYTAVDATLAGYIALILPNSTGDYVGDGTDQFNGAWISRNDGTYTNGDIGARIT